MASPDPVSLGTLKPGESATATVTICNATASAVVVDRIETSCDCLRAFPSSFILPAMKSISLELSFDPENDTEFRGGLGIDLVGFAQPNVRVLQTQLELKVTDYRNEAEPSRAVHCDVAREVGQ